MKIKEWKIKEEEDKPKEMKEKDFLANFQNITIFKFVQGYPLVPLYYGHFYGLFPKKNNFFSLTGYVQAKKAFFSRSKKSKKLKK